MSLHIDLDLSRLHPALHALSLRKRCSSPTTPLSSGTVSSGTASNTKHCGFISLAVS